MSHHLHIDPVAGLAGDMFLGACIDLGLSLDHLNAALAPLDLPEDLHIRAEETTRHTLRAIDFKVHTPHHTHDHDDQQAQNKNNTPGLSESSSEGPDTPKATHDHGHHFQFHYHGPGESHSHSHSHGHTGEHTHSHTHTHDHPHTHDHHPHHGYRDILEMIAKLDASDRAKARAEKILTALAHAEAAVHGMPVDQVHFHEVGAYDSIVDMLGAAVATDLLHIDTISCAPLPLGHGTVRCAHGVMPLPAPATANLLTNVPTFGVDRRCETVTPTGAAIAAALATAWGPQPPMQVEKIGYGAGDRDDADIANVTRLMLGRLID